MSKSARNTASGSPDGRALRSERSRQLIVDAIASFETWHRLRGHQNLSKKASIDIVVMLLSKPVAH